MRVDSKSVSHSVARTRGFFLALLVAVVAATQVLAQSNPVLAPDYPERYTVVKGDTLWDIAALFLRDPWRWPEVWQGNPQINNPDLIYPGDVLVMTFFDGKPSLKALRREVVKLSPEVRVEDFRDAIQPIDPAAIQPYLNSPLVTDEEELLSAGYIVDGFDSRLLMGQYDKFYARSVATSATGEYRIFRPGRHFVDPDTGESLGYEARHLGDAKLMSEGDPAKLVITEAFEDTTLRDRLRPVERKLALPFFYPDVPSDPTVRGTILDTPNRATELGALSVVAINLGERERIKPGDVLRIYSRSRERKDPMTGERFDIPEEEVGLLLVFRTFDKVSYAIITDSKRQVLPGDRLYSPDFDPKARG